MIKTTIFNEAINILLKDKITLEGIGNSREFYKVADVGIELYQTTSGIKMHCTCKHCSIHEDAFCTFQLSLLIWKYDNERRKTK